MQQFKDSKAYLASKFPKLHKLFHNKMKTGRKQCVLMFTEPIADNVLILGMPTFRNYYVTFDRAQQTVNFAKHDGSCKTGAAANFHETGNIQRLQHIDVSKLKYSNAYHELAAVKKIQQDKKKKSALLQQKPNMEELDEMVEVVKTLAKPIVQAQQAKDDAAKQILENEKRNKEGTLEFKKGLDKFVNKDFPEVMESLKKTMEGA